MAELSRDEMLKVLQDGGYVLFRGQLITSEKHLPSDAVLAKGDPAKTAAAAEAIDAQIKALQDAKSKLEFDANAAKTVEESLPKDEVKAAEPSSLFEPPKRK